MTADEWISVDEQLPEIIEHAPGSVAGVSDPVLVYLTEEHLAGSKTAVWRYFRGGRGDLTSLYWEFDEPVVTDWQRLPGPPKQRG